MRFLLSVTALCVVTVSAKAEFTAFGGSYPPGGGVQVIQDAARMGRRLPVPKGFEHLYDVSPLPSYPATVGGADGRTGAWRRYVDPMESHRDFLDLGEHVEKTFAKSKEDALRLIWDDKGDAFSVDKSGKGKKIYFTYNGEPCHHLRRNEASRCQLPVDKTIIEKLGTQLNDEYIDLLNKKYRGLLYQSDQKSRDTRQAILDRQVKVKAFQTWFKAWKAKIAAATPVKKVVTTPVARPKPKPVERKPTRQYQYRNFALESGFVRGKPGLKLVDGEPYLVDRIGNGWRVFLVKQPDGKVWACRDRLNCATTRVTEANQALLLQTGALNQSTISPDFKAFLTANKL